MKSLFIALTLCTAVTAQVCPVGTNYSLEFDGVDDLVNIPDAPELDGFGDLTIEFWIRHSTTAWSPVVQRWTGGGLPSPDNAFSFDVNWVYPNVVPGSLEASLVSGTSELKLHALGPINDGQWHHIALTRNGIQVSLLIDGTSQAIGILSGTVNATATPLRLGSPGLYDGGLDEVRIWNIHRTEAEILAAMSFGLSGGDPGLVGYWRLDDAPGQLIVDSSVNGNDGTLGASLSPDSDDPSWTGSAAAPLPYCPAFGTGQANGPVSSLEINGIGTGVGPFVISVPASTTLIFDWVGPPSQPFALLAGPLNPAGTVVTGLGTLDIGTPPFFSALPGFVWVTAA